MARMNSLRSLVIEKTGLPCVGPPNLQRCYVGLSSTFSYPRSSLMSIGWNGTYWVETDIPIRNEQFFKERPDLEGLIEVDLKKHPDFLKLVPSQLKKLVETDGYATLHLHPPYIDVHVGKDCKTLDKCLNYARRITRTVGLGRMPSKVRRLKRKE